MWHVPPFYLMVEWSRFRSLDAESQWETFVALLIAGSLNSLGDDPVIHMKSIEDPWGSGEFIVRLIWL